MKTVIKFLKQLLASLWEKLKAMAAFVVENSEKLIAIIMASCGAAESVKAAAKGKDVPAFFHNKCFLMTITMSIILVVVDLLVSKCFPVGGEGELIDAAATDIPL